MSKLLISDIHGNISALEAVLSEGLTPDITQVICLGDITGYYPHINECIELLQKVNAISIIGNHDKYLTSNTECPRSITVNRLLNYQKSILNKNSLDYLNSCPDHYIDGKDIFVHGSIDNYTDGYLYEIDTDMLQHHEYNRIFAGHTHVQKIVELKHGKVFCNPGAVGQPRDGDPRSAYAILTDTNISLKRVDYSKVNLINKMKELGFDKYTYENLNNGSRIGGLIDVIKIIEN